MHICSGIIILLAIFALQWIRIHKLKTDIANLSSIAEMCESGNFVITFPDDEECKRMNDAWQEDK